LAPSRKSQPGETLWGAVSVGRGCTGRGPRLALRHPLHERPPQLPIPKPAKSTTPAPVTNPRPSPPGRTRASSSMTAQTGLGFALPHWPAFTPPLTRHREFRKNAEHEGFRRPCPTNSLLDETLNRWNRQPFLRK
jgi:hypothetical protein